MASIDKDKMFTDTSEAGLETIICDYLNDSNGYEKGTNADFNREFCIDETRLFRFLERTQKEALEKTGALKSESNKNKLLSRIRDEITKRGIIDVLRNGVKCYPADLIMFYITPSENNEKAKELFNKNIFSVTRQLMYSNDTKRDALDVCIFINGLPVITIELKNELTNQNTECAVEQYKTDRNPNELLFKFKRCMVHLAVDDATIKFCTKLAGEHSWFLPFNKGYNDGAGNPPNPNGIKTDYLWKDILTKEKLAKIIENYAQVVEEEDEKTKKKTEKQIFLRYHQLDLVEKLLEDVNINGIGKRYLIEHSAGSGKSNSIAWLAHQLISINGKDGHPLIDSVIVVTDRRILDKQISNTIKQFMQVKNTVGRAEASSKLKDMLEDGKKIIISTVQKFPYILEDIDASMKNKKFAIIIDEAHSGESGRNSAQMSMALSGLKFTQDMTDEDKINAIMESRKLVKNASYFAFTATPKNKTLETFGTAYEEDGKVKHKPFHIYTMKQAIEEGFILDVLKNYTPINSYYKLAKAIEDNPEFDKKKSNKKLRKFVQGDERVISKKAELMVDHFHKNVFSKNKIGGKAKAMVVTQKIDDCIEYYTAISKILLDRKYPYKAIVAFSNRQDLEVTSQSLNGFPDKDIVDNFDKDQYRFLIVADMFQTGFDQPLLHTMYVDKTLTDILAVQTLSRLNRCHPCKYDTFVLDFVNTTETIKEAFNPYYKGTILSDETDPNKLYNAEDILKKEQVFSDKDVEEFVHLYLDKNETREKLDPILDKAVVNYKELDEDKQVRFKGNAKIFCRTYNFLSSILEYGNEEWEKLSIYLRFLIPKLPTPKEEDLSAGILETVELDSFRLEALKSVEIQLEDKQGEIAPVPIDKAGGKKEAELDVLTNILQRFNELFGNIKWNDKDNVERQIKEIPEMVGKNEAYQNAMKNSDEQNARMECEKALRDVINSIMFDNIELFKQYQDNPDFKKWLLSMVFAATYNKKLEKETGND